MTRSKYSFLKTAALVLVQLMLLYGCGGGAAASGSSEAASAPNQYATPEATAEAFVKAIAAEDFDAALDACAGAELCAGYDYAGTVERIGAFIPSSMYMPKDDGILSATNRVKFENRIASQANFLCMSLTGDERIAEYLNGIPVKIDESPENFQWFQEHLKAKPWKNLQIVYMENPMLQESSGRLSATLARQASNYGADLLEERLILYSTGESYYSQGMQFLRYGNEWKIMSLATILVESNLNGSVKHLPDFDGLKPEAVIELVQEDGIERLIDSF